MQKTKPLYLEHLSVLYVHCCIMHNTIQKQPKWLSTDEWIMNNRYTYITEYYLVLKDGNLDIYDKSDESRGSYAKLSKSGTERIEKCLWGGRE